MNPSPAILLHTPQLGENIGAAARAVDIFANAVGEFVGDPQTQGLSDIDVFAGDLDLHRLKNAPVSPWCQVRQRLLMATMKSLWITPAASARTPRLTAVAT